MPLTIGELFVSLGVKGSEKTVGAVAGVEKGMKNAASASLQAKAAIFGAMYALERLFSKSNEAGTALVNFNALTGESAQTLQRYQYAARQVGISNEETANTFKNLQSAMAKVQMGKGQPEGYGQVAIATGGITAKDVDDFMKNPELLLQRLQRYAQIEKRVGVRNEVLKSFGLSDNMIAGVSREAFRPEVMRKAPSYSDRELSALNQANIQWSNLATKIQMAVGHFNAMHGGALVRDISTLTTSVLALANAFIKFANSIKFFETLSQSVDGIASILNTLNVVLGGKGAAPQESLKEDASDTFKGFFLDMKAERDALGQKLSDSTKEFFQERIPAKAKELVPMDIGASLLRSIFGSLDIPDFLNFDKKFDIQDQPEVRHPLDVVPAFGPDAGADSVRPPLRLVIPSAPSAAPSVVPPLRAPESANNTNQTFNVNQTLNFAGGADNSREIGDTVKKAVSQAYRQMSSQIQGS